MNCKAIYKIFVVQQNGMCPIFHSEQTNISDSYFAFIIRVNQRNPRLNEFIRAGVANNNS